MSGSIFLANMVNLFIIAIIVETTLSAVFSITAVRMVEDKMVIKTTKEAVTYITTFLVLFFIKDFRMFNNSTIKLPVLIDYIISSLITVRLSLFVRDIFNKASQSRY